jgi:hypothetical protein
MLIGVSVIFVLLHVAIIHGSIVIISENTAIPPAWLLLNAACRLRNMQWRRSVMLLVTI